MFLSTTQVAQELGVCVETARKLLKTGQIRARRKGKYRNSGYVVDSHDLQEYMRKMEVKAR